MFYGSNPFRKDNPGWPNSNGAETTKVPGVAADLLVAVIACGPSAGVTGFTDRVRSTCGICVSWLIGLPRRVGARWYEINDAEAGWRGWLVYERCGGLGRQYRDARFQDQDHSPTAQPECPCNGDL